MVDRLGDKPIEPKLYRLINLLGRVLDEALNKDTVPAPNGFILMVFPFEGHGGRCNYISNANRDDVVVLLKEQLARFEGQAEVKGRG